MQSLLEELTEIAENMACRPTRYARAPEELHGMIVVIATAILYECSDKPFFGCMQEVWELVYETMEGTYPSRAYIPCLADDSSPERHTSFDVFIRNCPRFLELLNQRIKDLGNEAKERGKDKGKGKKRGRSGAEKGSGALKKE